MQSEHLAEREEPARPSVAVVGFDTNAVGEFERLTGSVVSFRDDTDYMEYGQVFDILVVQGAMEIADDRSHVLISGDRVHDGRAGVGRVSSLAQVEARGLNPADDVPEAFASAVNGLCGEISHDSVWFSGLTFGSHGVARPLVKTGETTVAALYDRGEGLGVAIPSAADVVEWFRAFLDHLHAVDVETVPVAPPRVARPDDWRTAHEVEAQAQLARIEDELAELTRWRDEALASLGAAARDAEIGDRWMLWASGDDLVGATRMMLEDLGLNVTEVDRDGREHLHVTAPDLPDWLALVEVAAFEGEPTLSDLRAVNHHRMTYIAETGTQPTQVWWVVNDHRGLDPSRRPNSLGELSPGATLVDVVAMTTRDLFRLGRDTALEKLDVETSRKLLTEAPPGVFSYDP